MIISPKKALDKGWLRGVSGYPMDEKEQLQQNGIDLRVGKLQQVGVNQGLADKPLYNPKNPHDGFYFVRRQTAIAVDSLEHVTVPKNVVALVIHRSSFNRRGIFITGSVYDSGFRGVVGATMYSFVDMPIRKGTRFAQIIFMEADSYMSYKGQYQDQEGN